MSVCVTQCVSAHERVTAYLSGNLTESSCTVTAQNEESLAPLSATDTRKHIHTNVHTHTSSLGWENLTCSSSPIHCERGVRRPSADFAESSLFMWRGMPKQHTHWKLRIDSQLCEDMDLFSSWLCCCGAERNETHWRMIWKKIFPGVRTGAAQRMTARLRKGEKQPGLLTSAGRECRVSMVP